MHSMFLVLMLTFAVATQGFDLTEKEANRTSTESRPLPTTITDKQINNAHFSRRVFRDFDRENPVDRKARHTMIVDSGITHSDFNFRGINKRSASEPSVERKARLTTIKDSSIRDSSVSVQLDKPTSESETPVRQARHTFVDESWINRGQFSRRGADGQGKLDMPLERQSRNTYIDKSQINDGRFSRRSANGLDGEDMALERQSRDTYIGKSQINDGRFSRRNTAELASEEKVST